jgi:hypothetical protein
MIQPDFIIIGADCNRSKFDELKRNISPDQFIFLQAYPVCAKLRRIGCVKSFNGID